MDTKKDEEWRNALEELRARAFGAVDASRPVYGEVFGRRKAVVSGLARSFRVRARLIVGLG